MPKRAAELTAIQVKRLTTPGTYAVGGWGVEGLQLEVKPSGARSWVLRNLVAGKRVSIGLGGYPTVTLEEARDRARELRKQSRSGVHPLAERAQTRAKMAASVSTALSFAEAAAQCIAAKTPQFSNPKHVQQWANTLKTYASPVLGSMPVDSIETSHVLKVLEPIWHKKTETATRVRQRIEAVLNWSAAAGHRSQDVANPARWQGHLDQLLPKPNKLKKVKHHEALPVPELPAFMKKLRAYDTTAARALELVILTAARSSEVRLAEWREFDLKAKTWTVPAERMKARKQHVVPLTAAAVSLLKNLPGSDKPASLVFGDTHENSLTNVLDNMDVDATAHGFRSSFKDWARSKTQYADEVSELCLAHVSNDATRAAYARDGLLELRRQLLNDWAKYLSKE